MEDESVGQGSRSSGRPFVRPPVAREGCREAQCVKIVPKSSQGKRDGVGVMRVSGDWKTCDPSKYRGVLVGSGL